jgi:hypothetical protein
MVPSRIELLIFALQSGYFLLARRLNQLGQGTWRYSRFITRPLTKQTDDSAAVERNH